MDAIFLSSGNLIADRRFEWARDLADKGDLAAAADLLTQVLELAPHYASAWFMLGDLREKLGDPDDAVAAFSAGARRRPGRRPRRPRSGSPASALSRRPRCPTAMCAHCSTATRRLSMPR